MADLERQRAPVGIVGGGPVGMMLALFLARYGVRSVLFNIEEHTRWHPKGNTHNSRTMEHYRRLGLSAAVRRMGLPHNHPTDVAYFTRYADWEVARLGMPSEAERMARVAASARTDQVPEPIHRANQMYVEAFLYERVKATPLVVNRFGWRATGMTQDDAGVDLDAERAAGGAAERWRFQYLVGCDGAHSLVRRALGIRYAGFENLRQEFMGGRMIATYLRLPTLIGGVIPPARRAWQYTAINPGNRNVLVTLDGAGEYLLFTRQPDPSVPADDEAVRQAVVRTAGVALPVEVLGHRPWTAGVAVVAERFGERRVMLAGDSAHLFTPTGGFGFNTGIDDTANLAWKLWALVEGWGGPGLLATYEPERRPIAVRNTTAARELAIAVGTLPVTEFLEERSPRGDAARKTLGDYLSSALGEEFASLGVQLGARYDGSRIVAEDGAPPSDDPATYRPSSVPGGRAPHIWLGAGRGLGDSLFDRLGLGFTLLCLGRTPPDCGALLQAARARGIPLEVLHLPDEEARDLYERDLALIRPDQHVAWRGNTPPSGPDALLARVTGA
ncbi:MAG TPA: FAD-dependent monooxygenase [Stellaceae bacterium]|nr:FAD-dependent monooxygenase [Stellaceae bacterium]